MRGIGHTFNIRSRVLRDFERSDTLETFLTSRRIAEDIEEGGGLCRLKEGVTGLIEDALMELFITDAARDLELSLLNRIKEITSDITGVEKLQFRITFRVTDKVDHLSVSVLMDNGSSNESVALFESAPFDVQAEVERVLNTYPHFAWLIDYRSPMFSSDVLENLKMQIQLSRLGTEPLNRDMNIRVKARARALTKSVAKEEKIEPEELKAAIRLVSSMARKFSNVQVPEITSDISSTITAVGIDTQATVFFSGKTPFFYIFGIRFIRENGILLPKGMYCAAIKDAVGMSWSGLYIDDYQVEELMPKERVIKYTLSACGYRKPTRRSEVIYCEVFEMLPDFAQVAEDDRTIIIKRSVRLINTGYKDLKRLNFLEIDLKKLTKLCETRKMPINGRFGFWENNSGPSSAPLPSWRISNSIVDGEILNQSYEETPLLSCDLTIEINDKSNIKYLTALGAILRTLLG
jgi:hypothetical protein